MKTAISIPDGLFRAADRLAKRLRISRSELYARAVERYVADLSPEEITARFNAVYGPGEDSSLDPELARMQDETIRQATEGDTW